MLGICLLDNGHGGQLVGMNSGGSGNGGDVDIWQWWLLRRLR